MIKFDNVFKILLSILFCIFFTRCQLFDPYEDTETVIKSRMIELNCPGLAAGIVTENGLVWQDSYGVASKNSNTSVDQSTLFAIASLSKVITGIVAMKAIEDGLIDLDSSVNNYIPFKVSHPKYPDIPITIRMLMTHTSGIVSGWSIMEKELYVPWDGTTRVYADLEQYLRDYLLEGGKYNSNKNFSDFKPGSKTLYSNEGITLLAYAIQCVTGISFENYCKNVLLTPLSIEGWWFFKDVDKNRLAQPYNVKNGNPLSLYVVYPWPAGSFITTIAGFSKIIQIVLNDGVSSGIKILEKSTVDLMLTSQTVKHYLIWEKGNLTIDGRSLIYHDGSLSGWRSFIYFDPKDKIGVITFANTDYMFTYSCLEILKTLFRKAESL